MFSVGEKVILQSKELPQYNGVHVVRAKVEVGDVYCDRILNQLWENNTGGVGYVLEEILPVVEKKCPHREEAFWAESALRKYHEPSDMSFTELLKEIKKPLALS